MNITNLKYKEFNFPFSISVANSNQNFNSKEVIILIAEDELKNIHYGEVSPLIGFSEESVKDCIKEINHLIKEGFFINKISYIKSRLNKLKISPSLRFGIEQLVLSMELMYNLEPYTEKCKLGDVKSNGLIGIKNISETQKEIKSLIDKEFKTIKLKIGRNNFDDDYAIVKNIYEVFNDKIKLRLDVNGSWNLSEAINNIQKLSEFNIEFIEQPVKEKDELTQLAKIFKHIIVPDESIKSVKDATGLINTGLFKFIVLKPTIRLGVFDTIKVIEQAISKDVNVIITSAFETAVGRNTLLYLASITNHNFTHGLSTELPGREIVCTDVDYSKSVIPFNINDYFSHFKLLMK